MVQWMLIMIGVIIILVGVVFMVFLRKGKNLKPDYYAFFVMGLIWLPLGIPLKNYGLSVMGLIFLIISLVNKDKWKQNRRKSYKNMNKNEKIVFSLVTILLGLLVLIGFIFYLIKPL